MEEPVHTIQNARVNVCVRLRPLPEDRKGKSRNIFKIEKDRPVLSICHPERDVEQEFGFDRIFDVDSSQEAIFESVCAPLVEHALEGFNSCCFAYGQTGSGKTYSIFGEEKARGIAPRAIELLFEKMQQSQARGVKVQMHVSFIENYIDSIRDLGKPYLEKRRVLDPNFGGKGSDARRTISSKALKNDLRRAFDQEKSLDIREDKDGHVYLEGLTLIPVSAMEEVQEVMETGLQYRATYETKMNEVSSRSHTVFSLQITQTDPEGDVRNGTLNLVDLAGSERLKKSGSTDQRKKEAVYINSSLSALGKVVMVLNNPQSYMVVPYRDSKLTRILQNSLGGNSFTTLLATLNPDEVHYEECLNTLVFAHNCRSIQNQPQVYTTSASGMH